MRFVAVIAVLVLITWFAVGQAPPAGGTNQKIAIVNTDQVLAQTAEGKVAIAELEKRFAPTENDLKAANAEIEKLQSDLQQRGATMQPAEQNRRAAEIQQKQKILERKNQDAQEEFNSARQEVIGRLAKRVDDVVQKYGNANGYYLLLDAGQAGTLFAGPGADVTKDIIAAYDKAYPAVAPAPTAPPAAKPPAAKKP